MKILMHQCCGPCSIYPLSVLIGDKNIEITSYFYNPNIHPVQEFYRRMESSLIVNEYFGVDYILEEEYGLTEFLRSNVFHEKERCAYCYSVRMEKTAEKAAELGYDAFSSTLLYSRMQNHSLIKEICEKAATDKGTAFYYQDFREGWDEGIKISKEMEIYRQNYCGCIYSEEDRFRSQLSKKFNKKYSLKKIKETAV